MSSMYWLIPLTKSSTSCCAWTQSARSEARVGRSDPALVLVVAAEARKASIGGVVPAGRSQKIAHPASAHVTQDVDRNIRWWQSRSQFQTTHQPAPLQKHAERPSRRGRSARRACRCLPIARCRMRSRPKTVHLSRVGNEVAVVQLTWCWIGIAEYEILVHHQLVAGVRVGRDVSVVRVGGSRWQHVEEHTVVANGSTSGPGAAPEFSIRRAAHQPQRDATYQERETKRDCMRASLAELGYERGTVCGNPLAAN